MAITYMENFAWSPSDPGDPWANRGIIRPSATEATNSLTLGRPGSGGSCAILQTVQSGTGVTFPVRYTPTMSMGFAFGHSAYNSIGDTRGRIELSIGSFVYMNIDRFGISYTFNGSSGFYSMFLGDKFAYIEISVKPELIELRVDNAEVARRAGTGFSAGTGQVYFRTGRGPVTASATMRLTDLYVADDGEFRGDSYVRKMAFNGTIINTGTVVGAPSVDDALSKFDSGGYIVYDTNGEETLMELTDIADNPSNIHGVMLRANTRRTETDNVLATPYVTVNGIQYDLVSHSPGPGEATRIHVLTEDPTLMAPWTKAQVNVLRVGMRKDA